MPRGNPIVYKDVGVDKLIQHYSVGELIGTGGNAVVKMGRDLKTNETVAIKIIDKSEEDPEDQFFEREIEILLKINHPRCIKLYDVFITHQKVFIVTEYVNGGEVLERLQKNGPYDEEAASRIFYNILKGIEYIHDNGVVHRDLKLENLLFEDVCKDSNIKITDFGLSKYFGKDETVLATMCGTPEYVAPEILGIDDTENYTPAVDMWSAGVVLFAMVCCVTPFYDRNQHKLYKNIMNGVWDKEALHWQRLSEPLKDLIKKLLALDPKERFTAKEALHHPWVTTTNGTFHHQEDNDSNSN